MTLWLVGVATGCVCGGDPNEEIPMPPPAFVKGADISWVTEQEAKGLTFRNNKGKAMECTALMKELGMEAIRLRVWVDPAKGWNGTEDVVEKALRAQRLGMKLMIDFHYSHTWADPGSQHVPPQWAHRDLEGLCEAMAKHTREVLESLKEQGVEVTWVQVGNETNPGMMHPVGRITHDGANYAKLTTAGYRAVKSVYPHAVVIVHLSSGADYALYNYVFDYLTRHNAQYDMIGMSLYPSPDNWHVEAANCMRNLTMVASKYGKPVMICEVGMSYDRAEECRDFLAYMLDQGRNHTDGRCKGVFYWEPQAPPHYNGGYTKGCFLNGRPTIALEPFSHSRQISF